MKNWFRNIFVKQNSFIGSVLFGALLWCLSFLLLPIETSQLSNETLGYLIACFTLFIGGYYAFNFKNLICFFDTRLNKKYFKICGVILMIAIVFRYIDLFYYRLLSFNFSFIENNELLTIWIWRSKLDELVEDNGLRERCNYADGTKMTIKTLLTLKWKLLELSPLFTAWVYFAKETWEEQSKEQGIVEGIFTWITDEEKRVIFDIYDL